MLIALVMLTAILVVSPYMAFQHDRQRHDDRPRKLCRRCRRTGTANDAA